MNGENLSQADLDRLCEFDTPTSLSELPVAPHYEVHGERGPFILFVHGILSSRAHWLPNLPAFTGRFRPVVVELLGHARSPSPDDPAAYSPAAYVAYFERIRETVGAERWYLVGQSLGAGLTLRYALDLPQRVIAHVFTNSNSALAPPGWADVVRPLAEQQARNFETQGRAALAEHRLNPTRSRHIPPRVKEALGKDLALHDLHGMAMTGLHTSLHSSVYDRVHENSVPTLLIVGERESRFNEARRFAETAIPHLSVRAMDAGHAVNLGAVEEFNEAVVAFFAEHPP